MLIQRIDNCYGDNHADVRKYLAKYSEANSYAINHLADVSCACGGKVFYFKDVRWLYLGCRCPKCNLTACYGDWKNEFEDYNQLLARV